MSTLSSSVHSAASLVDASEVSSTATDPLYQDESFEEESSHGLDAVGAEEPLQDTSGDEYDDDVFEDGPATLDYSADRFEDPYADQEHQVDLDEVEANAIEELKGSSGDEKLCTSYDNEDFDTDSGAEATTRVDRVRGLQIGPQALSSATNEDLAVATQSLADLSNPTLSHRWYSDKIRMLTTGKAHRGSGAHSVAVSPLISQEACHALRQQLLRNAEQPSAPVLRSDQRGRSRGTGSSLPSEFIDKMLSNVKMQRLLHTSIDRMTTGAEHSEAGETLPPHHKTHIDTFCSVKRADLEGKLATIRFEGQWARSCTNHAPETNEMSIGTLKLVQEMTTGQRSILRSSPCSDKLSAGGTLFSCIQTQALHLDVTVENTKRCLAESQWLREQADKLLRSRTGAQIAAAN